MTPTPIKHCPRCDAELTGSETACPQCKRPLAQATGLASMPGKAVSCPVCKIPTYTATMTEVEVSHCAECEGLGLRREAMMKLQPHGSKELVISREEREHKTPPFFEPRKKPPFLICPFCGKRMRPLKLGKTELDQCEKCDALWLEGPKLALLNELIGPYKWRASKG